MRLAWAGQLVGHVALMYQFLSSHMRTLVRCWSFVVFFELGVRAAVRVRRPDSDDAGARIAVGSGHVSAFLYPPDLMY